MSESVGWFGKIREKERVRLLISKSCQQEVWWLILQPIWPSPWEGWLPGDRRCLLEGVFFLDKYPPWAPRPPSSTILRTWARVREAFTAFKCENRGERSGVTYQLWTESYTTEGATPGRVHPKSSFGETIQVFNLLYLQVHRGNNPTPFL